MGSDDQAREERLRYLQDHVEYVTAHGHHLPPPIVQQRSAYCRDITFLIDNLARLALELKRYPGNIFIVCVII